MWPVAVHWVYMSWSFPGGAGQVQPHMYSAQGHPAWPIEQSEMAATCVGLGDSQAKPSFESWLAAAIAVPGAT